MFHALKEQLKFLEQYSRVYRKLGKSFEINEKNQKFSIFLSRNKIFFSKEISNEFNKLFRPFLYYETGSF